MTFEIDIHPMPAPRPRLGKHGTYNPTKYTKYKTSCVWLIKALRIPKGDYSAVDIIAYLPYPKSTAKKNRIEGALHRYKVDIDNILKGCLDVLQDAGVIKDDRQISDVSAKKRFSANPRWVVTLGESKP